MSEAKPTTEKPWAYVPEGQMIVMGSDITRMIADVRGWGWLQKLPNGADKQDANGRLIADAGTVHHQTGLTPSQLVERVKELEEALNSLTSMCEVHGDFSNGVTDPTGTIDEGDVVAGRIIGNARAVISKDRADRGEAHGQAPAGATANANPEKSAFFAWWEPYKLPEYWTARIDVVAWHAWQAATAQTAPAAAKDPSP